MYSNHIFPITDFPRALGLNFFSLVWSDTTFIDFLDFLISSKILARYWQNKPIYPKMNIIFHKINFSY